VIVLRYTKYPVDPAHYEALLKGQINNFPSVYVLFYFCSVASCRTRWDSFFSRWRRSSFPAFYV